MPKGHKWDWDEAMVLAVAREHRGQTLKDVAQALGMGKSTLSEGIRRLGIATEFWHALMDEDIDEEPIVDSIKPLPDVLSSEGREEYGKASELKYLRKEVKKLQEAVVNQENLLERIVSLSSEKLPKPNFSISRTEKRTTKPIRDALFPLFDMQYGQKVRRSDTPSETNEFNAQVFERRFAHWLRVVGQLLEDQSISHTIESLIIPLGGDMVEGDGTIFRGQPWQLELDPVEQVLGLKNILVEGFHQLIGLAKEELGIKNIGFYCVPGNHGKVGGKGATPATMNWDHLFFKMLEDALSNYPIDIFESKPAGEAYFDSQGWIFRMIHGQQIKGYASLPYYGLTKHDAKAIRLHDQIFHYLLLGHHHVPASISIGNGEHLMSGNWVGANNLSSDITAGGRPTQWAYFVSPRYGVGDRSLIFLEGEEGPARKPKIHAFSS